MYRCKNKMTIYVSNQKHTLYKSKHLGKHDHEPYEVLLKTIATNLEAHTCML